MFRKRAIKVSLEKQGKSDPVVKTDETTFEEKAAVVRHILGDVVGKVFIGVAAYVVLDTYRQVSIAKALRDPEKI